MRKQVGPYTIVPYEKIKQEKHTYVSEPVKGWYMLPGSKVPVSEAELEVIKRRLEGR